MAAVHAPTFGRPSPASTAPPALRGRAAAPSAAYRADGGDRATLSVRAAAVAGVRHRLAGRACEDAYAWATTADGLMVAVADGVGSTPGAAVVAAMAADAACAHGAQAAEAGEPAAGVCQAAVEAANQAVEAANQAALGAANQAAVEAANQAGDEAGAANRAALAVGGAPEAGATTLVVAWVDDGGEWALARVGDSTALVLDAGGWREAFPASGEADDPLSTATAALPAVTPPVETARGFLGAGEALILVTDGVAGPLRDGPETVAPALAAALSSPPSELTLALLADFSRQGCHDDRTVLGVWRRS